MTIDDLRRSRALRTLILDYDLVFLHAEPNPQGSMKREYATKDEKEIADSQSFRQSSLFKGMEERKEVALHNE